MSRPLSLAVLMLSTATLLSACQLTGTNGRPAGGEDVTANAVTGDPIEVQALDAAPATGAAAQAASTGKTADVQAPAQASAPQVAAEIDAPPAATAPTAEVDPVPAAAPEAVAPQVVQKSEAQIACEKKGGSWFKVGKGDKRACVRQTRDAGKRCERESQCDGVCLARSGTCAPFKPMYGCNEIFQDNGARVTLCLD